MAAPQMIPISAICARDEGLLRQIKPEYVRRLAESIQEIGLQTPIDTPHGPCPAGKLRPGDLLLTESAAILTYVAAAHGPDWLGDDTPVMRGRVAQWLAFGHRLSASIGKARTHDMLQKPADIDACRKAGIPATNIAGNPRVPQKHPRGVAKRPGCLIPAKAKRILRAIRLLKAKSTIRFLASAQRGHLQVNRW